jgi:signal transduction histidine kinase
MPSSRIVLKIAAPAIALSVLLLAVGVTAAWHVQRQQQEASELVAREVHGMIAAEELFTAMREIRRELDLLLRTHNRVHLANVDRFLRQAEPLIQNVRSAARTPPEQERVQALSDGFTEFRDQFTALRRNIDWDELNQDVAYLCDDLLTNRVLKPARECIDVNSKVVERTTETGRVTAQNMKIGFLLLGITGGVAGLLIGVGFARAVGRSIVRLDVSVRSVAGKLNEVIGPVQISHFADLSGLERSIHNVGTEITQVVERLQKQELDLLRSEQLAIVGQLAAGIAHELRNPLMPVKVLVQSALAREGEPTLKRRQLQMMNDELLRLEETIQSFLDFARPPALVKTRVDASDVVCQAVDLIYPKAHLQEVELHVVLPSRRIFVEADSKQLRQVLLNILLNALDAVEAGGLIEIVLGEPASLGGRPKPKVPAGAMLSEHDALRLASQRLERPPQMFSITILDSGAGLRPDILPRVFDPFVTTKDTGTGLGLPICQQIITAHGGSIRAANRVVRGACFEILLPRASEPAVDGAPQLAEAHAPAAT